MTYEVVAAIVMEGGGREQQGDEGTPSSTGVQLRTSVRVLKKLKHDAGEVTPGGSSGTVSGVSSISSTSNGGCITAQSGVVNTSANSAHPIYNQLSGSSSDKKLDGSGAPIGNGDWSSAAGGVGNPPGGGGVSGSGSEEKRKVRRRAPVLWSLEDKAAFFEALNENGKNFEAIQKYMTGKAKKRGDHSAKNREQARCFYYRTWHKLAKHIKMPQNIKKVTQELYGLINFGEMRKKVGKVTEKNAQKLNELIYCGSTQVRARGKTWRIKTPLCRALRKLNQMEETVKEVKLPLRVEVVLRARENSDAARVQGVGHNPRVKTSLPLETTLQSVISYLDHRWTPPDLRPTTEPHNNNNNAHQPSKHSESSIGGMMGGEGELMLFVGPRKCDTVSHPGYRCGPIITSSSLSLLQHEKRIGGQHQAVRALLSQLQIGKPKSALLKWQKDEDAGDSYLNADIVDPAAPPQHHPQNLLSSPSNNNQENAKGGNENSVGETSNGGGPAVTLGGGSPAPDESKQEFEARIRRGWNKTTSSRIRIGELYIMFGSNGVINLDYWWEESGKKMQESHTPGVNNHSTIVTPSSNNNTNPQFSKALLRLLSIARLYYTKSKVECPCGHVCKNQVKPNQGHVNSARQLKSNARSHQQQIKQQHGVHHQQQSKQQLNAVHNLLANKNLLIRQITNNSLPPVNDVVTNVDSGRLGGSGGVEGRGLVRTAQSTPGMFKQPLLPAPGPTPVSDFKTLQQFRPKYCNRRGRGGRKSVVVQRMLPLLPKTPPPPPSPLLLTLQVIQNPTHQPIRIQPNTTAPGGEDQVSSSNMEEVVDKLDDTPGNLGSSSASPVSLLSLALPQVDEAAKATTFTGVLGNNSVVTGGSGVMRVSTTTGTDDEEMLLMGADSAQMMLIAAASSGGGPGSGSGVGEAGTGGVVMNDEAGGGGGGLVDVSIATPPTSPSRILKEGESQWLNSEVSEFSLSSFLGQLDSSPMKGSNPGPSPASGVHLQPSEDTRLSADVESHFQSLMAESSLDYTAKFADLAEKIAASSGSSTVSNNQTTTGISRNHGIPGEQPPASVLPQPPPPPPQTDPS